MWEILHEGDTAVDMTTQVLVDLARNEEPAVGWDVAIFENDVAGVVRGQLGKGKIALTHQNLMDTSMTPAMRCELASVEAHLSESELVPPIVFVAENRTEVFPRNHKSGREACRR